MTTISNGSLSAGQQMEILKGLPSKRVEVECTDDILDTLFFANDDMPFANCQTAIAEALSAYWSILDCASRIFDRREWLVLSGLHSPFAGGACAKLAPASAAASVAADFVGDDWNDDVLALKALLPRIAALSDADFAAVNVVLRYLANLSCPEPISAMALKLPALKPALATDNYASAG
ncbi:MAG: hypothetical protein WBB98_17710 [Xanthobacteraceae bacterium]